MYNGIVPLFYRYSCFSVDASCRCTFFAFIRTFSIAFSFTLLIYLLALSFVLCRLFFLSSLFLPSDESVRIASFQLINELLISIEIHKRTQVEWKEWIKGKTTTTTEAPPTTKAWFALFLSGQRNTIRQDALLIISMDMDNLLNYNRNELTIENNCQATSLTTITHLIKHHHQNGFLLLSTIFSIVLIHFTFILCLPSPTHSITRIHSAWMSIRSYGYLFLFMFSVSIMYDDTWIKFNFTFSSNRLANVHLKLNFSRSYVHIARDRCEQEQERES